ncbi:S-layer homology domain-containing protein, partial [Patescibacteria group bacterium]
MRKNLSKLLLIIFILTFILPQTAFADFPDVPQSHKNYTAIQFLQGNNTINGYPDGTFKPNNTINRAEFLKIIIEGSGIPTDVNTYTPFPDVDHNAWYGPYIMKAYQQEWIQGYTDGTFRPEQSISKAEALKIVGESQNWTTIQWVNNTYFSDVFRSMWFAPYVSHAKEYGYLEDSGSEFYPNKEASRGYVSEVIYRSTVNGLNEIFVPTDPPTSENPQIDLTEITDTGGPTISRTFFEGFLLDQEIPTTLYKDEVFIISGSVSVQYEDEATIILEYINDSQTFTFTENLDNNHFEIPIHFRKSGQYSIGLIQGESGLSSAHSLNVLNDLPSPTTEVSAPNISSNSIEFENDNTFINYNAPENTIKRVRFTQNNTEIDYISRQNLGFIPIQYKDFKNFSTTATSFNIEIANLASSNPITINSNYNPTTQQSFNALEHTFSAVSDNFEINSLPEIIDPSNTIDIAGVMHDDFQTEAAIILPNGTVEYIDIITHENNIVQSQQYIVSGSLFSINYNPSSSGTYLFEINDRKGIAIINHPIYVNDGIPLIPDFFDLNERDFFSGPFNVATLQQEMLSLINQTRVQFGLTPVELSSDLNNLAQSHTDDMAINNYFAHLNLHNQSPDDRRIAAGIITPVGENLARDVSIKFAHHGLLRSAIHRDNILTDSWDRVGIGITEDNGYLLIAQEFSTFQVTQNDLNANKNELYEAVNDFRDNHGYSALTIDTNLENISNDLNDLMIDDNQEITNQTFNDTLDLYNVYGNTEALLRVHPHWDTILESILEEATVLNALWEKMGADVQ